MNCDLSKFELPKAELDGLTKELFGLKRNDILAKRFGIPMEKEAQQFMDKEENIEIADNINPDHYKSSTSLECIEAMDIVFGHIFVTNFCIGNAWKYIWRWKHKNGLEDLEKAKWYAEKAKHDILHESCDYREKDKLLMIVNRILDYIEVNNCQEEKVEETPRMRGVKIYPEEEEE